MPFMKWNSIRRPPRFDCCFCSGVISLACQNRIDVCRLNNLRSPVSLFLLTLAESGERKSTVDKLLMKPLYQLEENLFEKYTMILPSGEMMKQFLILKKSTDVKTQIRYSP
jgi:hypothetical protein